MALSDAEREALAAELQAKQQRLQEIRATYQFLDKLHKDITTREGMLGLGWYQDGQVQLQRGNWSSNYQSTHIAYKAICRAAQKAKQCFIEALGIETALAGEDYDRALCAATGKAYHVGMNSENRAPRRVKVRDDGSSDENGTDTAGDTTASGPGEGEDHG